MPYRPLAIAAGLILAAVQLSAQDHSTHDHSAMSSRAAAADTSYAAMQRRGRTAMGVDQYTSAHRFDDLPDGGRIVLVRDAEDSAGVRVILMTDHYPPDRRFLREGLRGMRDGVLFITETELSRGPLAFLIDRI